MRRYALFVFLLIAMLVAGCTQGPSPSFITLGQRVKTSECSAATSSWSPDVACTPGAINISATKEDICTPGYSSKMRDVSERTKEAVYAEYGITNHTTGEYEIDHWIPLELGGSNDISNLFPQAAEPRPGFHEKDIVENYLHKKVCSGDMDMFTAQRTINTNWINVLRSVG